MEKFTKTHFWMFGFIIAGLLFSGYLAGVKFFSDTCAFGSSCPIFLGYPACYTGFIVYSVLTITAVISLLKKDFNKGLLMMVTGASLFGTLFSGKLTFQEMSVWFDQGFVAFVKTIPLCSIGFLFFLAIFLLALSIGNKMNGGTGCCCGNTCGEEKPKEEQTEVK